MYKDPVITPFLFCESLIRKDICELTASELRVKGQK